MWFSGGSSSAMLMVGLCLKKVFSQWNDFTVLSWKPLLTANSYRLNIHSVSFTSCLPYSSQKVLLGIHTPTWTWCSFPFQNTLGYIISLDTLQHLCPCSKGPRTGHSTGWIRQLLNFQLWFVKMSFRCHLKAAVMELLLELPQLQLCSLTWHR